MNRCITLLLILRNVPNSLTFSNVINYIFKKKLPCLHLITVNCRLFVKCLSISSNLNNQLVDNIQKQQSMKYCERTLCRPTLKSEIQQYIFHFVCCYLIKSMSRMMRKKVHIQLQSTVFLTFVADLFNLSCVMGSLGIALSSCGQHEVR